MTPAAGPEPTSPRPRSAPGFPIGALVGYVLRSCVPPARWAAVLAPCLGGVLFALLTHTSDASPTRSFAFVMCHGILSLTLPVACLIVGDAVLGAEIRAGTFHFTWRTPVSTAAIVVGRWLGAWAVTCVAVVPTAGLAAVVAGVDELAGPAMTAAALASGAYLAVFLAIGTIARRAAVWSLAFVFLVERLLGGALSGVAQLSPSWEGQQVFLAALDVVPRTLRRDGIPTGGGAVVRLAAIAVVALVVAERRMRRLRLAGGGE